MCFQASLTIQPVMLPSDCPNSAQHSLIRTNRGTAGRPKTVTEDYLKRLRDLVSHDPRQFGYSFRRWTAHWLNRHLSQEYDISVSDRHINRLLKQMGLSTRTVYAASSQDRMPSASRITIQDLSVQDSPVQAPIDTPNPAVISDNGSCCSELHRAE